MKENEVEPGVKDEMQTVGRLIGSSLPEGYGFALLVFRLGTSGSMNYISNAERSDMINALKEFLSHNEAGAERN